MTGREIVLVPPNIAVARRLRGESVTWADYARAILKQAHERFTDYGSRLGTGPWYVVNTPAYHFKMVPIVGKDYYHTFYVRPSEDCDFWVFEVIS
jgi:hypothetical protein